MTMDPRLLRIFLAVCQDGSISAAARRLSVAQPSVSVAVAQLERSVGGELLVRGRKGVTLTPAGEALMRRAEMMEALLRDADEAVRLARMGLAGPLRVGGTPGALVSLVPAAIARMRPDERMSLHVIERSDAQLIDLLRRGEIEIALVTTGVQSPPDDIEETSLARDPFALIVGRVHTELGPSVSLAALERFTWVLPRVAGAFHRQIEALFLAAETPMPLDVIRCDSLLTSKEIVRRSARVTVLPRGVVAPELAMGVLRAIPIADVELNRSIGMRTLRGRPLSDLAQRFSAALVEE
ncbi:LysR family transcriptional regulator [Sphingomonas nostoxanthinifaciens]|uniref:LysR family transcriptional regulator n=1 Tax=Sphingomonas nostoxanthinifaciens TaxID=2872652 RepID=UPI001CC20D39|nr:LysR family transcriptional regulator [Sphingomonas nostoxanthinifaciens]UAK22865.1 LysR family transcriptional regulator [Sphingomonas nostoxanthinifaciens]